MDIRKLKKYFVKIIMIILFSFFMIPPTSHAYTPAPADISTDTLTEMNRNLTEMEKNAEKIYETYKITQKEDDIRKELCEGQYICKNNYFIEFRDDHLEYVEWCMERIRNIKEQVIMAENDSAYATEQWNYIQDEYEQTVGSYNYVDTCADILLNDYYKKVELNIKERKQVKEYVKKIKKKIPIKKTDNVRAKVKKINKYICDNYKYNLKYKKKSFLACLKSKKMVCWGYAMLFQQLCSEYGINVAYYEAYQKNNGGGHAWNIVKDEKGKLHYVDVTWNDAPGSMTRYLWISKSKLMKTHGKYSEKMSVDWN